MKKINISGIILTLLVTAGVLGAIGYFLVFPLLKGNKVEIGDLTISEGSDYNADNEVEAALKKLPDIDEGATIIQDYDVAEETKVAIIFQGLSMDNETNEKILNLLKEHNGKAAFFVSGMEAAENSEALQMIIDGGYELGDNALNADKYMEQLSAEDVIDNVVRSRKIIENVTNTNVEMAYLSSTFYTKNLCQAAKASGYNHLILPSTGHYLNYTSFNSYQQTLEYVNRLEGETVIVIKMAGALDTIEYEEHNKDDKPAEDKQANVTTVSQDEVENINVEKIVGWFLDALDESQIETQFVSDMRSVNFDTYIQDLLASGKYTEANIYSDLYMQIPQVAFTFEGMCDLDTYGKINELLSENQCGATFIINGEEIEENVETIKAIKADGYEIGMSTNTLEGVGDKGAADIYEDLNLCYRKLVSDCGVRPGIIMPRDTAISEEFRKAAGVMGYVVLNPENEPEPKAGEFYRFDLSSADFDIADVENAIKAAGEKELQVVSASVMISNNDKLPEIEQELIDELRAANEGAMAVSVNSVYTTDKGMSFVFYGVTNKPVVKDVLKKLASRNYKATFFVSLTDLIRCTEQIEDIIDAGHEIGLAFIPDKTYTDSFDDTVRYIITCQNYLDWKYKAETSLVKLPFGSPSQEMLEGISATGCTLVGHEYAMVRTADKEAVNTRFLFTSDFNENKVFFHRGSIVYFNMNFYDCDVNLDVDYEGDTLMGKLLKMVYYNKIDTIAYIGSNGYREPNSEYKVKTFTALNSAPGKYKPGSYQNSINVYNSVLGNFATEEERFDYMKQRYIGNPNVDTILSLPGFSDKEIASLDKTGKVGAVANGDSNNKVIFLTFDDWGTDSSVNELLYVLGKYNVKASFFVKTQYVDGNPNLLRAIAVDGHMIGSHTDTHYSLSNYVETAEGSYYEQLDETQAWQLRYDIVKSYNKLNKYVGDVKVNNVKALSKIFRNPTLATSRVGMYQVFDVGYQYIVSGDFSSRDYEAPSVEYMVYTLQNGIHKWNGLYGISNGSVVIMHMSENAKYTAAALDIMIPYWQSQGYTFARLDEYLH